jgi:hypothetical protein
MTVTITASTDVSVAQVNQMPVDANPKKIQPKENAAVISSLVRPMNSVGTTILQVAAIKTFHVLVLM